jgi:uncharacterized protein (TIGR03437 family)
MGLLASLTLIASTALGQDANIDLARIVGETTPTDGRSMLSGPDGSLYLIGVTENQSFNTTPGAIRVESSFRPIFIQRILPDGSIGASALLADSYFESEAICAKIDSQGNLYVGFQTNNLAGYPGWQQDGRAGVARVSPNLDKIIYATHVADFLTGPMSLDLDPDGSVVAAVDAGDGIIVTKLASDGSVAFTYRQKENENFATGVGVAVLPDHSIAASWGARYLYRFDASGTQVLSRVVLGLTGKFGGLCAGPDGSTYLAVTAQDPLPPSATLVDYTRSIPRTHSLVLKFDLYGNQVYSAALATANVKALAADGNGSVWGAGWSYRGIRVFQLNSAGNGYQHYLTIPADVSELVAVNFDQSGRLLLAGRTVSEKLPDRGPSRELYEGVESYWNAFFVRMKKDWTRSNLKLTLEPITTVASQWNSVQWRATLTNSGDSPIHDIRIVLPPPMRGTERNLNDEIVTCLPTGDGVCTEEGPGAYFEWRGYKIAYPSLAPGQSETVDLEWVIFSTNDLSTPVVLSAISSSDDPDQQDNNCFSEVPIRTSFLKLVGVGGIKVNVDEGTYTIYQPYGGGGDLPGLGLAPGTTETLYVPSPQFFAKDQISVFAGWGDGSMENPRVVNVGSSGYDIGVRMRAATEPWVNPDAPVQNAGSFRNGGVAPGEIVTLFGFNLGPKTAQQATIDQQGRIATMVTGFRVLFDGVAAPVIYTSSRQSSVIVPHAVAGKAETHMVIEFNGLKSDRLTIPVVASAPGLMTANYSGSGQILAYNPDWSLNSREAPIARGEVIVIYGTGEGLTQPVPLDGELAGPVPPKPELPSSVTIGGLPAEVVYLGGVTGLTSGLFQLNVRVPSDAVPGLLPVVLTVGSNSSQREATIAVR